MEGVFFLLALVVCVHGTSHLSFSEVIVTRSGCGDTKTCQSNPNRCDPAGEGECLFLSTAARDPPPATGVELKVELRGESTGYIALGLAADVTEGTLALFVCGSNDGTFFFRTLQGNINTPNAPLTPTETRVKEIRGTVSGNVIKCEFTVESLNAASLNAAQSRSSQATTFSVLLGNGPVIVTRSGCGLTKTCLSNPNECDPAGEGECLFLSTAVSDPPPAAGVELKVELRGESTGYIALGLAADVTEDAAGQHQHPQRAAHAHGDDAVGVFTTVLDVGALDLGSNTLFTITETTTVMPGGVTTAVMPGGVTTAVMPGGVTPTTATPDSTGNNSPTTDSTGGSTGNNTSSTTNGGGAVHVIFSGCGYTKSCVAIPVRCNPAGRSACLFLSIRRPVPPPPVGFEVTIELRGDSAGYIALGLADTRGGGNVALFVCASNNGKFFFRTLQSNIYTPNAPLTPTETMVKEIRGTVKGTVIKCEFKIDLLNAAQSGSSQVTIITILLRTGTVNGGKS
ncbi:Ferric-chelate reductase 1 [Liparis tanakae]|uniref:Ferric-chelate reductase 1 n=1 Tax=Liparis tanakae TaxID=230148 RepID=A0A4Z2F2P8_9TELE|nr:Ferric-chelate reductase 1 [Liparis tanakae]